jgi:hypothetical protein
MLTSKDFEVLAEYLGKDSAFEDTYTSAIKTVSDACKYINGHFDKDRFAKRVKEYHDKAKSCYDDNGVEGIESEASETKPPKTQLR